MKCDRLVMVMVFPPIIPSWSGQMQCCAGSYGQNFVTAICFLFTFWRTRGIYEYYKDNRNHFVCTKRYAINLVCFCASLVVARFACRFCIYIQNTFVIMHCLFISIYNSYMHHDISDVDFNDQIIWFCLFTNQFSRTIKFQLLWWIYQFCIKHKRTAFLAEPNKSKRSNLNVYGVTIKRWKESTWKFLPTHSSHFSGSRWHHRHQPWNPVHKPVPRTLTIVPIFTVQNHNNINA